MAKTAVKKTAKSKLEFDYKTIKSFEDACKKEGINPEKIPDVSMLPEEMQKALISVYKLFVVFKAIKNGWEPDWTNWDQYKYFPWFEVNASEEVPSGFGFSASDFVYSLSVTTLGSRLCIDTREKALYIASQFEDLYKDFLLIIK